MSDDVKDRLGARFEDETADDQDDTNAEPEQSEQNESTEQNEWDVENVKNAWNANTFLLPDSLDERFDDEYGRLNWQTDGDFKKDRHYKPLVVYLGLEQLADKEGEEVSALLQRMERKE